MITLLNDGEGPALLAEAPNPADGPTADLLWAGRPVTLRVRDVALVGPVPRDLTPGLGYEAIGPRLHAPAVVVPSDMVPPDTLPGAAATALESFGERLVLSGNPDMQLLGEAIHGFLAADRPGLELEDRREIARGLLQRWGVAVALKPDDLLRASDRLRQWVDSRWPGATWHREWPLLHRQPDGTIVRGTADLVIEHAAGFAVVDHKSFPGSAEQAALRAAGFAGQLAAYAAAVAAATSRPVTECFVHLPVIGAIVPVRTA